MMNYSPTSRNVSEFDLYRLRETDLFRDIPGIDREVLGRLDAHIETYRKDKVICERGQVFPWLCFLISGEAESGYHGNNYYQMLSRFHDGEMFATAIAMRGVPSPVEVRAVRLCEVLQLNCEVLLNSPNDPVICMLLARVTRQLTERNATLINKVRTLRNPVVIGRIAEMLLNLPASDDGVVLVDLNQTEIGEYLGSSRSRVSGALAVLVNDGLVESVAGMRHAYRIIDRRGLEYTAFNGKIPESAPGSGDDACGEGDGDDKGAGGVRVEGACVGDAGDGNTAASDARASAVAANAAVHAGADAHLDVLATKLAEASEAAQQVSIDSARTMRAIVTDEPLFEKFLQHKGFPFSADNPITEIVTFDDVVSMQGLDKEAFLAEYAGWKANRA